MAIRRAGTYLIGAVILDWAGTTVDYGCFAPVEAFMNLFEAAGVPITSDEARSGMGKYKRDHIVHTLSLPSVHERWVAARVHPPEERDVEDLFHAFFDYQQEAIRAHSGLIPRVIESIGQFREMGLKIGSCTGYTRLMMTHLIEAAREQGYEPDAIVCADEVRAGRPAPWMCLRNAEYLDVYPPSAIVKIGDTTVDVEEGLNAGMWTIGVAKTGNELGLQEDEIAALDQNELNRLLERARARLTAAGAHYVVDCLADAPDIVRQINQRLRAGERP